MADKAKELLEKVKAWWNKFTSKQKTIIIGVAAVVVLAFAILFTVLSQTKYVDLRTCETAKEASEITELLETAGVKYTVSDDGLRIKVDESKESDANLLLGANGFMVEGYSFDNVTSGGFSATETDKQRKYVVYLQDAIARDFIGMFESVKTAVVKLNLPENDGTLIQKEEEASAAICLGIDGEFTTDNAAFLAKAVSTILGNETTERITIMDTKGNLLYSGEDNYSIGGAASTQLDVKKQAESQFESEVKRVLGATNEFSMIEVAPNLDIDFSSKDTTTHDYSAPDGRTEGMLANENIFSSEAENGSGDVPGTDSNTETTYVLPDSATSSSTTTEENREYLPNERVEKESQPAGKIIYENSSIAVTGLEYVVINEDDAKRQGLLDGITWEEYKINNAGRTRMEVDDELYSVVSNATGIPLEKITIVKYSENYFVDSQGLGIGASDIVQIILIIVILALLGFVVLRSMASKKEETQEEELSVETLLQSTPASELEDIEVETKSETRKMIDKFVEENPEAAANLLRNWLNEDWG